MNPLKLNRPLAKDTNADPGDVLHAKHFLYDMGFYEPPEWGITEFPDHALFNAIRAFQQARGLKQDGIMKPGGSTEATIQQTQSMARQLQGMGRHGDTILAHINPAEAKMLKAKGGAGTVNPATGLLEFYEEDKKEGSYIWHTAGDSRVRSSHVDRDGEVFSWDDPPEGGHPGEAPNCRCTAEDVKDKEKEKEKEKEKDKDKKDCEKIRRETGAANRRINDLLIPIENTKADVKVTEEILDDLISERHATREELAKALIPGRLIPRPSAVGIIDAEKSRREILRIQKRLDEIEHKISIEKYTLANKEKELEQLERKRETHRQTAEELSQRYQDCIEKNKKPGK